MFPTQLSVVVDDYVADEFLDRLKVGFGDALRGVQHEHQVHQGGGTRWKINGQLL